VTAVRVLGTPEVRVDLLVSLVAQVSRLATLSDVVAWAETWCPPARAVEAIEQDEFAHDIVLALEGAVHVVFAST
jgi:hypothetical protein